MIFTNLQDYRHWIILIKYITLFFAGFLVIITNAVSTGDIAGDIIG